MDPVALIAIPGVIGGVCVALFLRWLNERYARGTPGDRGQPVSTDVINIARIRVAGVGGLGLVAMALVVAVAVPAIGRPLAAGFVLGGVLGVALILVRRSAGPIGSSSARPGANTTLSVDQTPRDARH